MLLVLWLIFALSFLVPFAGCGVPQETYQNLETQQAALDDKFTNLEDRHLALQESYKDWSSGVGQRLAGKDRRGLGTNRRGLKTEAPGEATRGLLL